jgi:SAM-dependent methyltransferase
VTAETAPNIGTPVDTGSGGTQRASHGAGAVAVQRTNKRAFQAPQENPQRNFRFFDNRQKYLLFVNTCSEKWAIANRVALELQNIHPRPPAVRLFDAGVGDGTVLTRVMRAMHARFPTQPFYIAGKEISLEDVRLALEKMPDRFYEHPSTVLVLTNLNYSEAPWLTTRSPTAATSFVWHEVALIGDSSAAFEEQITDLQSFLAENWKASISPRSGNPVYERPVVLVIYREDYRFPLNQIIPRPGVAEAEFDLVIASQPYRARASVDFKAEKVIAPLSRALGPGGRLIAIHSKGNDPGMEVIQKIWPDDNPFQTDRHDILRAVRQVLKSAARHLNFNAYSDARSVFRYDMHTLPNEIGSAIGTSTLFAAWNAAVYVAQIEDERLEAAVKDGVYLGATREVLNLHQGLWFNDESYVITRRRS